MITTSQDSSCDTGEKKRERLNRDQKKKASRLWPSFKLEGLGVVVDGEKEKPVRGWASFTASPRCHVRHSQNPA